MNEWFYPPLIINFSPPLSHPSKLIISIPEVRQYWLNTQHKLLSNKIWWWYYKMKGNARHLQFYWCSLEFVLMKCLFIQLPRQLSCKVRWFGVINWVSGQRFTIKFCFNYHLMFWPSWKSSTLKEKQDHLHHFNKKLKFIYDCAVY